MADKKVYRLFNVESAGGMFYLCRPTNEPHFYELQLAREWAYKRMSELYPQTEQIPREQLIYVLECDKYGSLSPTWKTIDGVKFIWVQ